MCTSSLTPDPRAPTPDFHAIRLRGPWGYQVLAQAVKRGTAIELIESNLPPPGRVTMPADWGDSLGADFRGQVLCRRKFNGPTGIAPALRVWLVFDGADACAAVSLNDTTLGRVSGPNCRAEFDVTALVRHHNTITAIVEKPLDSEAGDRANLPGGLIGEVRLEIRGPNAGWLDQQKLAERDKD